MTSHLFSAIKLTLVCLIFFSGIYPAVLWGIAQFAPNDGKGEIVAQNGKPHYANIGQSFTEDRYFNSRPSAAGYNAAASCGSNKGPSNPDYLAEVQARIDTFAAHNPGIAKNVLPADLVTASGSGLDPHISVQGALVQVKRIAAVRNLNPRDLELLVAQQTEQPLLGLLGTARVNVLQLNLSLDNLK